MAVTVVRTAVAKNLDELFFYAIRDDSSPPSIVGARRVVKRGAMTGAAAAVVTALAARGAGYSTAADKPYAVALSSMKTALEITLDAKTLTFSVGDPPGTAVTNVDDSSVDISSGAITYSAGTSGDQFALVAQPPSYSGGLLSYVTAVSQEPPDLRRAIRDKGQLQHYKKMAIENGVITLTAKYQNAKAGLAAFVDQDFILVGEREDDRNGTITEKLVFYGARINALQAPNESEGDTDTDIAIPVSYELLAIVGQTAA